MAKKKKDLLFGYPANFDVRALLLFTEISGKQFTDMKGGPEDLIFLARAAIKSALGEEPEELGEVIASSDGIELLSLTSRFAFFRAAEEITSEAGS